MSARKSVLAGLVSLFALLGVLMLAGASANAAAIHSYLSQITEVPAGPGVSAPGPFALMESMTVDSGHLWVAERFNGGSRADEFNASTGAFISQFVPPASLNFRPEGGGIAVGHSTGAARVYVGAANAAQESVVAGFDEAGALQGSPWTGAGTPAKSFGSESIEVAVDNSTSLSDPDAGDVYVAVATQKVIDVFHPEADGEEHYVGQITSLSQPYKIVVNESSGDLVVLNGIGSGTIDVLEPATLGGYTLVREITSLSPGTPLAGTFNIAVDTGTGEIYATEGFKPTVIDEFSSNGTYLGHIVGADSPGGNINDVYSLAADPVSHDVYVADNRGANAVKIFGPDIVIPDVTTGSVANPKARSGTLTGTVNPDKAGVATCQFVWGTSTEFGHTASCPAPVAEGESPVPVEAQLSGLEPGTTYYYLLQATDAHGTNAGEPLQIQRFTTPGPNLEKEAVSAVTADSVTFDATIDPRNARTSYYIQYGTTTDYGTDVPAPPGEELGSGEVSVESSQHVQHLSANTLYYYRVVAVSEVVPGTTEEFDGPDQTFTTQRSTSELGLSDGREWELVSPADKHGALFFALGSAFLSNGEKPFVAQASADGGSMVDLASQPTEDEPLGSTANAVSIFASRGASGWSSQDIALPHSEGTGPSINNGQEYRFFSEDLSGGVVQPFGPFKPLSPEASESTPYIHADYLNGNVDEHCQSSCFQPLVTKANTQAGTVFGVELNGKCFELCGPRFYDSTPDLSHVVLGSPAQLTSTANERESAEGFGFYEWSAGQLQPLYLLPKNEGGNGVYAGQPSKLLSPVDHQFSDGGSVFFPYNGHLYLHDFARGESVRLDVAQGVAEPSQGDARFLYASSDGSRMFFTDSKQLTKTGGGGIYECRIVEAAGSVTCALELTGLSGGQLVGGSKDASYLYFIGTGEQLVVDRYNGREWTTTEGPVIPQSATSGFLPYGVEGLANYRISPNGRFIAFMSDRNLIGFDNRDAVSGQPDEEVYLYDASSNRLVCASCNPTGGRPTGVAYSETGLTGGDFNGGKPVWVGSSLPPWTVSDGRSISLYQPRYLSDSGRLFFNSNDALVPQDVNGTQDLYEYEPAGVGDCSASSVTFGERSGACVGLISSGSSSEESAFLDASETGGDVFFITLAKLLPQDYDNALDVYDAHGCSTTAPCYPPEPVLPPVCSTGDACKASPTPQPTIFGPSPSATFSGPGNIVSAAAPAVSEKSLSRAQKLARALKACRKRSHKRRGVCERKARRSFKATSGKAGAKRKGR